MKSHPVLAYAGAFAALLALTALTTAMAFVDLGPFNAVVAITIAAGKALVVAFVFMHVRRESLVPVFALVGLVWLGILLGLTLADFATRV
jgi:cytochrome c oxidase subunit 4